MTLFHKWTTDPGAVSDSGWQTQLEALLVVTTEQLVLSRMHHSMKGGAVPSRSKVI